MIETHLHINSVATIHLLPQKGKDNRSFMKRQKLVLILISLFCLSPVFAQVTVTTDDSISVSPQELSAFREKIVNRENRNIEVMIYSLTTSREIFYLDERGELQVSVQPGYIRCMITKPGDKSASDDSDVFFVESSGSDRAMLFIEAAQKITLLLNETAK